MPAPPASVAGAAAAASGGFPPPARRALLASEKITILSEAPKYPGGRHGVPGGRAPSTLSEKGQLVSGL